MANTPEGKVKDAVKKMLKGFGAYFHMPVQAGYGAPTLDFIGCHRGKFFAIETKAPGKTPTPRQLLTIREMEAARAITFVIDDTVCRDLKFWLNAVVETEALLDEVR
jgi:hypothetical protein